MARLIDPGGEGPVNEAERRVVETLVRELPDDYAVIPNLLIHPPRGQRFEYDAVVIAPHAVYAVEVKGWNGHIRGDQYEWLLNGRRRRNPMLVTEHKAKALKTQLVEHAQALSRVRVEAVVVLAGKVRSIRLKPQAARMVVGLAGMVALLADPAAVEQPEAAIAALSAKVEAAVLQRTTGRTRTLRFGGYEVVELLEQSDEEATYRARRVDVPGARPEVRLRVVTLSPYLLDEAQRSERLAPIFRDVHALWRMGVHPNVETARDVFTDDDGSVVVVLDAHDDISLRQRLTEGTPLTVTQRLDVLADICGGLAHAHANGVVHRRVTPAHILLDGDGRARLADFDLAKLTVESDATVWQLDAVDPPDRPYLAPELSNPTLGPPGPAADLYGAGLIAWELFAGEQPALTGPDAAGSTPPGIPHELAELVRRLLHPQPTARDASAADVLAVLERVRGSGPPTQPTSPKLRYETGDVIDGRFEVRTLLGSGGFRTVYRVYQALHDCEYALKVYNHGGYDDVRQEITILRGIDHPYVERVIWADQTSQGQWYLATELVDGRTLKDYVHGGARLGAEEVREVGDQLLAALVALHDAGTVHRDVKPDNLIRGRDGVVLIDFNIASPTDDPAVTGRGTQPYTAPDATQPGVWLPTVDLFSAGVTLYELLCGEHPYQDRFPSVSARPVDPRERRPDVSPALAEFLLKACAPTAAERFASAAEMRHALASVDTMLAPVAVSGTDGAPDWLADLLEEAPPNVNPVVTEFLGLNSQARRSNRETRGLSPLARSTYVDTRLDTELTEAVLAGRHRLVVITGNAGDGKTAFIQQTEAQAERRGATAVSETAYGRTLRWGEHTLHTLYDGSEEAEDRSSDEMLGDFLAPFAAGGADDGGIRLAAVNEGRLRGFISAYRERFPGLVDLIGELDEPGSRPDDETVVLVNLNLRSVTAGGQGSIFSRQVRAIVDGPFWGLCKQCDYRARCPIKHNVDTLADPDSGAEVTERFRRLVDLVRLRRRRHLTLRDVRSLISHLLFRDRDCEEIAALLAAGDESATVDLSYFQGIGGRLGVPPGSDLERGAGLLHEADVAEVANPAEDRALAAGNAPARMHFERREADGPYGLLTDAYEKAASAGTDVDPHDVRRTHAALRRMVFFERRDDNWRAMLPYKRLQDIEEALTDDTGQVRHRLRDPVLLALSTWQGMRDTLDDKAGLWLSSGEGGDDGIRGFRWFPADEFEVRVAERELPYVEFEPDRLELMHARTGTSFPIDLDVLELLDRLREGYVPSPEERQGLLVHVELFLNQLRRSSSNELLLVKDGRQFRITAQPGGAVALIEVTP